MIQIFHLTTKYLVVTCALNFKWELTKRGFCPIMHMMLSITIPNYTAGCGRIVTMALWYQFWNYKDMATWWCAYHKCINDHSYSESVRLQELLSHACVDEWTWNTLALQWEVALTQSRCYLCKKILATATDGQSIPFLHPEAMLFLPAEWWQLLWSNSNRLWNGNQTSNKYG